MRYALAFISCMLLMVACFAMTNLPDIPAARVNSTTGLMTPIELVSAVSRHVIVFYPTGAGINITNTTFTENKSCDNSTQAFWNCSANTTSVDGAFWIINESASTTTGYNASINISNTSFMQNVSNASSFDLAIYGGHYSGYSTYVNNSRTCNSTNTSVSGTCAGTGLYGGANYTALENSSLNLPYNITINISNTSFGVAGGLINLAINAGYFGDTTPVTIDILNNDSVWVNLGQVNVNSMDNRSYTGLNASIYAAGNITQLRFNHAANGDNSTNATLVVDYAAANITYANAASGNVSVSLYSNKSTWVTLGYLSEETLGWVNLTGLDPRVYAPSNLTQILFNHSANGTSGATGIKLDYVAAVAHTNATVATNATIAVQGSIDNSNWFTFGTMSAMTSPTYLLLTNMTATFVRFNITSLTIGNNPTNYVTVRYLGVY